MSTLTAELKHFMTSLVKGLLVFLILTVLLFGIGLRHTELFGRSVVVPVFSVHSISARVFEKMSHDLVPSGVQLVVTSPLDAFIIQTEVAALMAIIILSPYFLFSIIHYISPALYRRERRALFLTIVPVYLLFFAGASFAYTFIIPKTFEFLYIYVPAIGATPLFLADVFVANTLSMMVVTGLMFQLPVCMVLLSYFGVIPPSFWRRHWRYAVLTFLAVTAIITPDGSGVTMLILSLPLTILYVVGLFMSERHERRKV